MLPKSSAPTSGKPGLLELPEVIGSLSLVIAGVLSSLVPSGPAPAAKELSGGVWMVSRVLSCKGSVGPERTSQVRTRKKRDRTGSSAQFRPPPRSELPPEQQPPEEAEQPVQPWSRARKRRGGGSSAL